ARFGHIVTDPPQVHDAVVVHLAKVIPDGSVGRYDVQLISAVGDHVVDTRRQPKVLAPEVPAHIHKLHCIERAPASPWRSRRMSALAPKFILDGDKATSARRAI